MKFIYGANLDHVLAFVTGICTTLSLIGSLLVILAFFIARTRSNPRAARLIRNLAIADFIWFAAVFIESIFWIFTGPPGEVGKVPGGLCYVLSPLTTVSRVSSLMWTSVVAFDVLQSVTKRSFLLSSEPQNGCLANYRYMLFVYAFSLPGGIATIIVHSWKQSGFGCGAGYEKVGIWYEVLLYELIPILLGFSFNIYVFWKVRLRMAKRAFPLSVRKRRRRVMFNYIRVCIICWIPTMMFYLLEICGVESALFQVISRGLLYLTGFFNFIVFGMQDLYLKRSMQVFLGKLCCGYRFGSPVGQKLLNKHLEKTVMFADENILNADIIKDKKSMYRNHRLSREDKKLLYKVRPDLNLKSTGTDDEDSGSETQEAPVTVVSWAEESSDSSRNDSSSAHSLSELGAAVKFASDSKSPPSSPSADRKINNRPATPRRPKTEESDMMEWDIVDEDNACDVEAHGTSSSASWMDSDPTEALLSRDPKGARSPHSSQKRDDNSSSDEGDEEDEELMAAMIAVSGSVDQRHDSSNNFSWSADRLSSGYTAPSGSESPKRRIKSPPPSFPARAKSAPDSSVPQIPFESSTRDSNEDDDNKTI